jgi:DNA replication and repair protein RecF
MTLQRIQVSDFRCLRSVALDIDPSFTLISGPNASGKTSLLEAIHVLGRGRSFRSRRLDQLVNAESDRFVIHGSAQLSGRTVGLGIEGSVGGVRARVGSQPVSSLADLAVLLPVQIIDPELHRLIEEGPARRRRFLDWGVFHVEHTFLGQWQRFQQVLRPGQGSLPGTGRGVGWENRFIGRVRRMLNA